MTLCAADYRSSEFRFQADPCAREPLRPKAELQTDRLSSFFHRGCLGFQCERFLLMRDKAKTSGGKPPSILRDIQGRALALMLFLAAVQTVTAQESAATRERRAANAAAAEATVTINEQFLNSFLTAMFDNLSEPSMPLTMGGAQSTPQCPSEIHLKREVNGTRTAVHFENGKIVGSLAFAGAYSASLMGCIEFTGWADADVNLDYDASRHALVARFQVRDIHLNNTPAILNGPLLGMVQGTIDRRYNPVELFTLEKLSTRVDIQPAGGALQLRAKEVRSEVTPSAVTLHIVYEFVRG